MSKNGGIGARETGRDDGIIRTSSLVARGTGKMAKTYVGSTLCAAAVVIIDTLIAGVSIGPEALAAIAAAGPLLTLPQILHCLLGYGIDKLMVQAIGEGKRKEADRIFGAVLIAVLLVFLLVFVLLIMFERPLLDLIMDDPTLVDMVVLYTVPLFATAPVFEAFLCIERAFRIDGRARLFSKRAIVTNVANIVFDFLLVSVLDLNVSGLAWASVISTTLGYAVPLSHFFSKKRTVSPDFSVLGSPGELLSYVKKDVELGGAATLDELMGGVALGVQTAAIGFVGGPGGLAIWAVYKSLRGVALSVGNGVSASVSVHAGLLFGQRDYDGVRYSVKHGAKIALTASTALAILVLILAEPIAMVYGIEPELQALAAQCLRIGCVVFPPFAFMTVVTAYLPAVNEVRLATVLVLVQHVLTIVSAAVGYIVGLLDFFVIYGASAWLAAFVMAVLLARDRFWFVPEHNPEAIANYSVQLNPDQIAAVSVDVGERLVDSGYPASFCSRAELVAEDGLNYIAHHNPDATISADIGMLHHEGGVVFTVLDDGMPYNPIAVSEQMDWDEPGALEAVVVLGFAASAEYDRMLDFNRLTLFVKPPAAV